VEALRAGFYLLTDLGDWGGKSKIKMENAKILRKNQND
jgi:hypothetical protein